MKRFVKTLVLVSLFVVSGCNKEKENKKVFDVKSTLNYTYRDTFSNYVVKRSTLPNKGKPKLLVIPIYFCDSSDFILEDKKETVRNDINKAFFGTNEETGWRSVTKFYEEESQGDCILEGTVAPWFYSSDSFLDYAPNNYETTQKTAYLVNEAIENYFDKSQDDRTSYDIDKDGFIDAPILVYGAPDYSSLEDGRDKQNLWAYNGWILSSDGNVNNPQACNYLWASYDFMYSSSSALEKAGTKYGSGDTCFCNIDTHYYIHEVGHMFGLPDYYDYSYQYSPAGGFSMQDFNVGGHDPFSLLSLGWVKPYIPVESCKIEINKFQSSHDVILLSNNPSNVDSPFDEYFLVELYSSDGLNSFDTENKYNKTHPIGIKDLGIRLWHVDARLLYSKSTAFNPNSFTTNPKIEGYKVIEMMSNTYSGIQGRDYISQLGSAYADYNILQLIRNDEIETRRPLNNFDSFSLFHSGDKFSMSKFKNQFVNKGKLNSLQGLGWTFDVEINGEKAIISCNKI